MAKCKRSVPTIQTWNSELMGFFLEPGIVRSSKEKWDGWKSAAHSSPALSASYWLSCDNSVWQMQQHAATFLQCRITDQIKTWPAKPALLCSVVGIFLVAVVHAVVSLPQFSECGHWYIIELHSWIWVSGVQLPLSQKTYRVMEKETVSQQVSLLLTAALLYISPTCTHSWQLRTLLPLHFYFT